MTGLFPDHSGPAFRAGFLETGHAALMGFLLPAFWADTVSGGSGRRRAPPASGLLAAAAALTPLAHTSSFFFVHKIALLLIWVSSAKSPAAYPPTTRHGMCVAVECTAQPGPDHLAQSAGHERDDPDPIGKNHFVYRPGNRPANQRVDAHFRQAERFLGRHFFRQRFAAFVHQFSGFRFDEVDLPDDIENRCDSIIPGCKGRFHGVPLFLTTPFDLPAAFLNARWRLALQMSITCARVFTGTKKNLTICIFIILFRWPVGGGAWI
jgi:hypothetical protein